MVDGCEADLSNLSISYRTKIGPPPETTAGNIWVWSLRDCRKVAIPEGTERIGSYWFYKCDIESITFPASVREIGP